MKPSSMAGGAASPSRSASRPQFEQKRSSSSMRFPQAPHRGSIFCSGGVCKEGRDEDDDEDDGDHDQDAGREAPAAPGLLPVDAGRGAVHEEPVGLAAIG